MTKTGNEIKMDQAKKAIHKVFEDKSVEIEETIANLGQLIGQIEILMDALRTDL